MSGWCKRWREGVRKVVLGVRKVLQSNRKGLLVVMKLLLGVRKVLGRGYYMSERCY